MINQLPANQDLNKYHLILDTDNILHFIELNKTQEFLLSTLYQEHDQNINVVKDNWDTYIKNIRGQLIIDSDSSSSSSNNEAIDRLDQQSAQGEQLYQSEVIIVDTPLSSQLKKPKISQDTNIKSSIIDQVDPQQLQIIIQEEVDLKTYEQKIAEETQGKIETFIRYWESIKNKSQFDVILDQLDTGRDFYGPFYMQGDKSLIKKYNDRPTQIQILNIYLNYQRERIIQNQIGQTREQHFFSKAQYMEGKFKRWLQEDTQNNNPKLWKVYDIEQWDDDAIVKMEQMVKEDRIQNLFLVGSQLTGYINKTQKGTKHCLLMVTRQLGNHLWVCDISSEFTQTKFIDQFCRFFYSPTYNLNYLASNWNNGLAVCMFCTKMTNWFEGLSHLCNYATSVDLMRTINLSTVNIK